MCKICNRCQFLVPLSRTACQCCGSTEFEEAIERPSCADSNLESIALTFQNMAHDFKHELEETLQKTVRASKKMALLFSLNESTIDQQTNPQHAIEVPGHTEVADHTEVSDLVKIADRVEVGDQTEIADQIEVSDHIEVSDDTEVVGSSDSTAFGAGFADLDDRYSPYSSYFGERRKAKSAVVRKRELARLKAWFHAQNSSRSA